MLCITLAWMWYADRDGMGWDVRRHFAANSRNYWQKMQRRRLTEAVLPQRTGSYAEHP